MKTSKNCDDCCAKKSGYTTTKLLYLPDYALKYPTKHFFEHFIPTDVSKLAVQCHNYNHNLSYR